MAAGEGRHRQGTKAQGQQTQAQGYRRPLGGEGRREVLRVQRQRGDMQQDQAYPQLHGVCRQSSRFQRDGARVDRAAGRGLRRTRMV